MRALVHIENRLDGDLSLAALSRIGHLSAWHFQRVFAGIVGATPAAFVRRLRLERAARALRSGRRSIASIARQCGFTDVAPFYRAFRARFGETPAEFRRRRSAAPKPAPMPVHVRSWVNDPLDDGQLRYVPVAAGSERGANRPAWRVVELPPLRMAFVRGCAPREAEVFRALADFASRRHDAEDLLFLRLVHDDDAVAGRELSRTDIGVVLGPRRRPLGRIGARQTHAGHYVVATVEGNRAAIAKTRQWLERTVIPQCGSARRDAPVIEIVLDDPRDLTIHESKALTDVLVPIEESKLKSNWYWRRRRPAAGERPGANP
jgi:AraC family transcriptional regulator